ncbi:hypothetical protein [Erysipelothrix anatis]|uniref:hypothetical protein n=1 Tax=Erysipelothrix anatis TaxID=2683713 RepID=UPI00135C1C58|nr:hypothetical protein [Erysipelothrix anatis]
MEKTVEILSSVLKPENTEYERIVRARILLEKEIAIIIEDIRKDQIGILGYDYGSMPVSFRIKSESSFKEKIIRKRYLEEWGINAEIDETTAFETVCVRLTDLIGARINCLFESDEVMIYNFIKSQSSKYNLLNLSFNENTIMKNGKTVHKLSGKIKSNDQWFSFEIQIKSSISNLWGEIEHSSVYKRRNYIPNNAILQKEVIEQSYKILNGSDSQLKAILTEDIEKTELKKSLFYAYCEDECKDIMLQSKDFELLFDLFFINSDSAFARALDEFLSKKIVKKSYNTIKWIVSLPKIEEKDKQHYLETIQKSENGFRLVKMSKLFSKLFELDQPFEEVVLYQIIGLRTIEYESEFEGVDEDVIQVLDSYEDEMEQDEVFDSSEVMSKQITDAIKKIFGEEK